MSDINHGSALSATDRSDLFACLQPFSSLFQAQVQQPTPLVQHSIDTGDSRPISSAPHRASAAENDLISSLVDDMLTQGVVQESRSPWSSPVVLVRKKDGSPRFCVDYRRLNVVTTRDVYPLPRIDDTLHALGSARIFSTLDLTASYWQIALDESSRPKSAFVCRKGLF
ncbi:MAG: reverse transcriptase family protein, partial [Alphaproteobacteria bacterium]